MHYAIHEGTFELPDAALDRTVNILMMNAGPGGLNLVIARGRLRDGRISTRSSRANGKSRRAMPGC